MTTTAHSPAVARALADIEAAKENGDEATCEFLDLVADLVIESGDPRAVFDRVIDLIARERAESGART